jgi:hypothetical protein
MNPGTILAVDLGRHKRVTGTHDGPTRAHPFRTLDATPDDLTRLLARHPGAVIVEGCAIAGWVHNLAVAAGHVATVGPARSRDVQYSAGRAGSSCPSPPPSLGYSR